MRVIMPAIIDQAGRSFNADETDGVSGRDNFLQQPSRLPRPRPSARRGQHSTVTVGIRVSFPPGT